MKSLLGFFKSAHMPYFFLPVVPLLYCNLFYRFGSAMMPLLNSGHAPPTNNAFRLFLPLERSSSSGQVHGRRLPRCMRRRRSGGVFIIYGACTICQIAIIAAHICQATKKYPYLFAKSSIWKMYAKSQLALSSVFQGTEKSPPPKRQKKNYQHNNSKRLIVLTLLSPVPFSLVPCLPLYAGEYLQQPHYGCEPLSHRLYSGCQVREDGDIGRGG